MFCAILLIAKTFQFFAKFLKIIDNPVSIRKGLKDQRFLSMGRKIWRKMLIAYVTNRGWQGKRWFTDKEDEKSFRYWTVTIWRKRYNDVKPKSWQGFKFVSISTNRDRSLEEGDKSINRIDLHSKWRQIIEKTFFPSPLSF